MPYTDPPAPTNPAFSGCVGGVTPTFSGCAVGIGVAYSEGEAPALANLTPSSMKAGLVVPVTLNGSHLMGVTAVNISGTLIAVTNINVVSDDQLIVTFTLDVAALEGTRKISVTTPNGTSNELDILITPGMWLGITVEPNLWMEADFGVTGANGASVTQVNDRSSYANHLLPPSGGKTTPIYRSSGWNGGALPYLEYNNAHGLETAFSSSLVLTSATIFCIFQRDAADANSCIFSVTSDLLLAIVQDSAASWYAARWNAAHTVVLESSYHTAFGYIPRGTRQHMRYEYPDGTHANHKVWLNNVRQDGVASQIIGNPGILAPTTGLTAQVRLGWRGPALPGFDMQGRMAAYVQYSPMLSAPNIAIVHNTLHAKWMS